MKQYRVVKEMPFSEVGQCLFVDNLLCTPGANTSLTLTQSYANYLLKEGWIEEVSERKTLEQKYREHYLFLMDTKEVVISVSKLAKDHYLGLLDEADKAWNDLHYNATEICSESSYYLFLRNYLESEGKI